MHQMVTACCKNCQRFYELIFKHLMAHLRPFLKISRRLMSGRSGMPFSFRCCLFLLGIVQHSSHIVSQDTVFILPCQIPVSQQVSEIPSFLTSIEFLGTFFSAKSFFKAHQIHLCIIRCLSKIFQHISGVKALLSLFYKHNRRLMLCVLLQLRRHSTPLLF